MAEETFENILSLYIEKDLNGNFALGIEHELSGSQTILTSPLISCNMFYNDKLLLSFENPSVFETYYGTKVQKITVEKNENDMYVEIYVVA